MPTTSSRRAGPDNNVLPEPAWTKVYFLMVVEQCHDTANWWRRSPDFILHVVERRITKFCKRFPLFIERWRNASLQQRRVWCFEAQVAALHVIEPEYGAALV